MSRKTKCVCGGLKSRGSKTCRDCYQLLLGTWGEKKKQEFLDLYGNALKEQAKTEYTREVVRCKACGRPTAGKNSRCRFCQDGIQIPVEAISDILEDLIAERNYETNRGLLGGIASLERETGFVSRQIYSIFNGKQASVSYNIVDRILTRTGNFLLWYTHPELSKYYDEPEQKKSPRRKPKLCKGCGTNIKQEHSMCRECYKKSLPVHACACGTKLAKKKHKRCLPCLQEAREREREGRKKWNQKAGRHFARAT